MGGKKREGDRLQGTRHSDLGGGGKICEKGKKKGENSAWGGEADTEVITV